MIENVRNDGDSTKEDPAEAGLMIGDLAVIVGRLAAMTEVLEISEDPEMIVVLEMIVVPEMNVVPEMIVGLHVTLIVVEIVAVIVVEIVIVERIAEMLMTEDHLGGQVCRKFVIFCLL